MPSLTDTIVEILPDKAALIDRAYQVSIATIEEAIAQRDRATLALSGGSTPRPLYESLAKADLPWEKIYIFWGDERYVPQDDPKSNARMTREAWLNQVPIPTENIFPVPTRADDPAADAAQYEATLKKFFPNSARRISRLRLCVAGHGRRWSYGLIVSAYRSLGRARSPSHRRQPRRRTPDYLHRALNQPGPQSRLLSRGRKQASCDRPRLFYRSRWSRLPQ